MYPFRLSASYFPVPTPQVHCSVPQLLSGALMFPASEADLLLKQQRKFLSPVPEPALPVRTSRTEAVRSRFSGNPHHSAQWKYHSEVPGSSMQAVCFLLPLHQHRMYNRKHLQTIFLPVAVLLQSVSSVLPVRLLLRQVPPAPG